MIEKMHQHRANCQQHQALGDSSSSASSSFGSNTFPLASRSSIKRPLSLSTAEREYNANSILTHHNRHHLRGFRCRAKTIHATHHSSSSYLACSNYSLDFFDAQRARQNVNANIGQSSSSSFSSPSSSSSSSFSSDLLFPARTTCNRAMMSHEFRRKNRADIFYHHQGKSELNKSSSPSSSSSSTSTISKIILDEEMEEDEQNNFVAEDDDDDEMVMFEDKGQCARCSGTVCTDPQHRPCKHHGSLLVNNFFTAKPSSSCGGPKFLGQLPSGIGKFKSNEHQKMISLFDPVVVSGNAEPSEKIVSSPSKCAVETETRNHTTKLEKFQSVNIVEKEAISTTRKQQQEHSNHHHSSFSAHIPTEAEKAQFQRSLDSATTLVFHRRSGLPLTSSPAPIRKSGTCFDFDSSLTSVNAIKKALFEKNIDDDAFLKNGDGSDLSSIRSKLGLSTSNTSSTIASGLLGNFEESVLNGRIEPVSIVHGFRAEIGASGSFVPPHKTLPVTVFFYTLHDTDKAEKMSSPYLGHINLGNKGYSIPRQGTVQVTLFNPNETVVKMFVVQYDLSDMPPSSRTFLRQRTLFMPSDANENCPDSRKWLRYLIHLRFQSSKSGRIRLHTDIRILVFRKHDLDVATLNGGVPFELRSFVQMPSNPKYSKNIIKA